MTGYKRGLSDKNTNRALALKLCFTCLPTVSLSILPGIVINQNICEYVLLHFIRFWDKKCRALDFRKMKSI